MTYIVGLTGGIGSGKSAAGECFSAHGINVVDTDAIAHALTAPNGAAMSAIEGQFGREVIASDGSLDRAAMRRLVFSDPETRRRLEGILHPMIRQESDRAVATATSPYVVLMIPLLIESRDYRQRVQRVVVVDCPEETQIARVVARNGLAPAEVERILAAQIGRSRRLEAADDVIDNAGPLAALAPQVDRLHEQYLKNASQFG